MIQLTAEEHNKIAGTKSSFKQFKKKHRAHYHAMRDDVIKTILNHRTPNWGNLNLIVTKHGV